MLFFGHVGLTIGVVQSINELSHVQNSGRSRRWPELDLRIAAFVGLLPDLIDKPIGIIAKQYLKNHTRLIGHSLLATIVLYLICRAIPKMKPAPLGWALVYLFHMILDRVWYKNLEWFFWPLLGSPAPDPTPIVRRWISALNQPYTIIGELTGLTILCIIGLRHRLYRRENLKKFWRTGILDSR